MDRLEKLRDLEARLQDLMETAAAGTFAQLAKQYRETLREIEEIEGTANAEDEISDILRARKADGKSGAVRKDRSKV